MTTSTEPARTEVLEEAPTPLRSVGRHWIIASLLTVLGLAAGLAYASTKPEITTAEARLIVGSQNLKDYQVPGYAYAATQLAGTYSHFVGLPQARAALNKGLGRRAGEIISVSGSPVPETGLVSVEVQATSRQAALSGATLAASQLKAQANAPTDANANADNYFAAYNKVSAQLAELQSAQDADRLSLTRADTLPSQASQGPRLRSAIQNRSVQISAVQLQQSTLKSQYSDAITNQPLAAGLKDVQSATVIGNNRRSTFGRYGIAGLVAGFLLAVVVAVGLDRRVGRRRNAAASGLR